MSLPNSIAIIVIILLIYGTRVAGTRVARKSIQNHEKRFAPEDLMRLAHLKLFEFDGLGAEGILIDCSQRYPEDPGVWFTVGSAKALLDKHEEALDAYRKAMALAPYDPTPHSLAAMTLHEMGRDSDALAECRTAILRRSPDPYVHELIIEIERGSSPN